MSQSYSGDESIIAQENKLLRERLAKAEADARRLDWLDNRYESVGIITTYKRKDAGAAIIYGNIKPLTFKAATIREAIDNAIAAQAKP